jgi:hypothetical protein
MYTGLTTFVTLVALGSDWVDAANAGDETVYIGAEASIKAATPNNALLVLLLRDIV